MDLPTKKIDLDQHGAHGKPIRVAIADDHPLLLSGLAHELGSEVNVVVVGSAQNSTELVALLNKHPVDVIISDYTMPGGNHGDGISLFGFLKRRFPSTRLVALTMMTNPGVIRSLIAQGVHCILSKADSLVYTVSGLHAALANKRYFSPTIEAIVKMHGIDGRNNTSPAKNLTTRELEVVRLFVSGLTVSEIADQLHRSKQTISTQKMSAMRKLGIHRDADLIMYGIDAHLITHLANTGTESVPFPSNDEKNP